MEQYKANQANCIRVEDMGGLELFKAFYTTHAFSRHWHDGYGIGVIEAGCEVFDYRGDKHYASPFNVILMNPGVIHTGQAAKQELGWNYRIMYPHPELIRKVVEQVREDQVALPHFPNPVSADQDSAGGLLRLFDVLAESTSVLERESVFLITVAEIIRKHATFIYPNPEWSANNIVAEHIREYIENYYFRNISLAELSMISGKSQFHLLRIFQKRFGLPPHTYQTLIRIRRAKNLLLEGKPISEIALDMGFADQSHFTRLFKRVVGITPYHYCSNF
ncbi:MAG TPA: AraC family transcriptional regulator [Selenomonadales bacterium]|nr:AraC family transcriptional regulator [Selenomonadales bacterium]